MSESITTARRQRVPALLLVFVMLAAVAIQIAAVTYPSAAAADVNLGSFQMTPNAGVVGIALAIKQVAPCPQVAPGYRGYVSFYAISSSGAYAAGAPSVDVDAQGNWMFGGVAGKREVQFSTLPDPYYGVGAFVPGTYTVGAVCGQYLNDGNPATPISTGSYTPQILTITGPAYTLRAPTTTVAQGSSITVAPARSCAPYGPNVRVYGMNGGIGSATVPLRADGTWPDVTLQVSPDAPLGIHYVYATCGNYAIADSYQYSLPPLSGPTLAYQVLAFTVTASQPPAQCGNTVFIAAAGSGQYWKSDTDLSISPQLTTLYKGILAKAGTKTVGVRVLNYPATSLDALFAGVKQITARNKIDYIKKVKAKLQSNINDYLAGEKKGLAAMWGAYTSVRFGCPSSTRIVLGGYSQGSMVVHEFLNELAATNDSAGKKAVIGAALLADPERVKHSTILELSDAQFSSNGVCALLSAAVSCAAPDTLSDIASFYQSKAISVCSSNDPICDTSELLPYLQSSWNKGARDSVINLAKVVHESYRWLPATTTAGKLLGQRVAKN